MNISSVALQEKIDKIRLPIPTWELCDEIGGEYEGVYLLSLRTAEDYYDVLDFYARCRCTFDSINESLIGHIIIVEEDGTSVVNHGTIDDFCNNVKNRLTYLSGLIK